MLHQDKVKTYSNKWFFEINMRFFLQIWRKIMSLWCLFMENVNWFLPDIFSASSKRGNENLQWMNVKDINKQFLWTLCLYLFKSEPLRDLFIEMTFLTRRSCRNSKRLSFVIILHIWTHVISNNRTKIFADERVVLGRSEHFNYSMTQTGTITTISAAVTNQFVKLWLN